jgi:membrane protease YdiL (CAAX protease family)
MHKYRDLLLIELPFYAVLVFLTTKFITTLYILIHNTMESEQWSYSLIFRNQNIVKNFENILSPIILSPLFETLFFCVLLYRLCKKIKITNVYFIFVSGAVFGAYHLLKDSSGWYTFSYTFVAGLVFAYCYNKQNNKHGENKAYIFTSFVHALGNGLNIYI